MNVADEAFTDPALSESVTYTSGGAGKTIRVLWFDPYRETLLNGVRISNKRTSLWCLSSDINLSDKSATITRGGVTYTIMEIEPNPDDGGADKTMLTLAVER